MKVVRMCDILTDEEWDEDILEDERQDDLAHLELDRTIITNTNNTNNNNTTESSK